MFNRDFYPTPRHVIEQMFFNTTPLGKKILEPQGGKGDIVDYCIEQGAKEVAACELNDDLRAILATKCKKRRPQDGSAKTNTMTMKSLGYSKKK